MDTATTGVHPQQVLVAVLVPDCRVYDLDGGGDEAPASPADVGAGAAGADGVIVGHVDIEDELALLGGEVAGSEEFTVAGLMWTGERMW